MNTFFEVVGMVTCSVAVGLATYKLCQYIDTNNQMREKQKAAETAK